MRPSRFHDISQETEIVWLENPLNFRWLRESVFVGATPYKRPPFERYEKVIGFARVQRAKGQDYYSRRCWTLRPADSQTSLLPVSEAVMPWSVTAGKESLGFYEVPLKLDAPLGEYRVCCGEPTISLEPRCVICGGETQPIYEAEGLRATIRFLKARAAGVLSP